MTRYSFDDLDIGILSDSGNCLSERLISRPNDIENNQWHVFAGEVIKLLNRSNQQGRKSVGEYEKS